MSADNEGTDVLHWMLLPIQVALEVHVGRAIQVGDALEGDGQAHMGVSLVGVYEQYDDAHHGNLHRLESSVPAIFWISRDETDEYR